MQSTPPQYPISATPPSISPCHNPYISFIPPHKPSYNNPSFIPPQQPYNNPCPSQIQIPSYSPYYNQSPSPVPLSNTPFINKTPSSITSPHSSSIYNITPQLHSTETYTPPPFINLNSSSTCTNNDIMNMLHKMYDIQKSL